MSKSPLAIKKARQLNCKPGFLINREVIPSISSRPLKRGKG
jgi:hypothetical protein